VVYRQYLTSNEVWSGLMVELVRALEGQLSSWWQRRRLALHFHWRKRPTELLVRLVLPLLALLAIVVSLMVYGVLKLRKQGDAAAAASVLITGTVVSVLTIVARVSQEVKQVGDTIVQSLSYLSISDYRTKLGLQSQVSLWVITGVPSSTTGR
jgi:hypothetical protein